jgi:hypothetical protein
MRLSPRSTDDQQTALQLAEAAIFFKHSQNTPPLIIITAKSSGSVDRAKGNRRPRVRTNYLAAQRL